ncbi:MAG: class I SAM-dependent methyltransferase [Clostridia bacterium]|nr:class I SAM-dependent methyltransferase [Clostridia bacterium]
MAEISDKNIDGGKSFDWGKTSEYYAKYRDIYPQQFYDKIISRNLCLTGQTVLDVGTGTGVIPRNMYRYGANWVGTDISENQIEQARILSANTNIKYFVKATEELAFPADSFDVITACQCFWYFDHKRTAAVFDKILKSNGRIILLYMAWLPYEDKIAKASEDLVLKFNPQWSGAGETIHPIGIPDEYKEKFELVYHEEYPLKVHFTRESWNGRMKTCRGIGASITKDELTKWEHEHINLLERTAPEKFDILHYAAIAELKKIK